MAELMSDKNYKGKCFAICIRSATDQKTEFVNRAFLALVLTEHNGG